MIGPCKCSNLHELSRQNSPCKHIQSTDNISNLLFCPRLLDKQKAFHAIFHHFCSPVQEKLDLTGNTHWPHHTVCLLKSPLPLLLLHVVILFCLPEKVERDIFNDFFFVTGQDSSAYTASIHLHKQHKSSSCISIFLHRFVQNINPTFYGNRVHDNFMF